MKPTQLRFWPDPRPAVDRLGEAFFRELPERPGVYLMYGAGDTVLYVGKARNLRHRLSSYRVANPDRLPRRLLRLLHRIERIDWETCEDETAALQREAALLLSLKPRFNRAGVWPKPRRFVTWRVRPDGLELALTEHPEPGWHSVGPSGAMMTYIHRALVRLLWRQSHPERGLAGMPAGWFGGAHGPQVLIPPSSAMPADAAAEFLALLTAGDCEEVQRRLVPAGNAFEQLARDEDWTLVTEHFARPTRSEPASSNLM
ncbi:MAG TPA: nucleotide excision repair endonuclease [Candidatus Paceibacterota bacterium]|nr:nucleotide excision repair endonuclease [Candidatus Paceibacterota bacterium]